jgi:hypothetical protein
MPASSELFFDLVQLRSQPVPHRLPKHDELPIPGLTADMRETQEVENLGLAVAVLVQRFLRRVTWVVMPCPVSC